VNKTRCPRGWLDTQKPAVLKLAKAGTRHEDIALEIAKGKPWKVDAKAIGAALARWGKSTRGA